MKPNRKRYKTYLVRFSEEEYEQFLKKQKRSKLNKNDYILKCVLNKKITVVDGVIDVIVELKRIGNNINQLTKLVHQGKVNYSHELSETNKELVQIWQSLKSLTQKQV